MRHRTPCVEAKMYLTLLLSLLVACTGYLVCSAQPICRDLLAPFPYGEASYCPEYGGFGCCGKREERRASKWAADAQLRLITDEEKAFCSEYTRNVSCLTCRAHLRRPRRRLQRANPAVSTLLRGDVHRVSLFSAETVQTAPVERGAGFQVPQRP